MVETDPTNGDASIQPSATTHLIIPSHPEDPNPFPGPFEGPEKLLEVWFAPSPDALPSSSSEASSSRKLRAPGVQSTWRGLRQVPRTVWEEMLDIVKCKVLSVVEGEELDAYLLSESSLFVAPHLLILKTCGTTLNLLGLHRIIEIAREYCGFTNIWRCFYSRKSFFFPERQHGPHRDWRDEVNFLDSTFAYTVGPMNRDHWLLYLTSPNTQPLLPSDVSLTSPTKFQLSLPSPSIESTTRHSHQDTTLEILMSHLSPDGRAPFFQPSASTADGHELGATISTTLGIDSLFGPGEARLDSYGFDPCGYSANAVIGTGGPSSSSSGSSSGMNGNAEGREPGGGYYTIHVTPEEGWSYASFECNVPLPSTSTSQRPDLPTLIRKVVDIFQPNRLSITLFVSTPSGETSQSQTGTGMALATSEVENAAWKAFSADLLGKEFERKDRIGYEFDGYDLVFACFEKKGWKEPKKVGLP